MSSHDGEGISPLFSFNSPNSEPLSVWHLDVTRKQLRPIWMQYLSPVIRSHFCHVSGELIVESALRGEIQAAVSKHYSCCRLFDDPSTRRRR